MREVRVSCASFGKSGSRDEQLARALAFFERAALDRPDLVVLPENCFNDVDSPEPVPGPVVAQFSERCRRYRSHLLLPLIRSMPGGRLANSVLLIDGEGELVGEYQKMFPTDKEMNSGIVPGREARVFETSFGRIGVAICFDLNFPEVIEGMARQGVELVCFPSAFQGGRLLARWALEHGVYIASAHRGGIGMFVDQTGVILEQGDGQHQPVITRDLNLDRRVFHLDYNYLKLPEIRRRYGRSVRVEVYRPEALFALESRSVELSVDEVAREYGLERLADYLQRSREQRDALLPQAQAEKEDGRIEQAAAGS